MDKLRFAPLVRVSTESQEREGESLRTQKAQIEQAVKALNGTLIADPWRYSGQEHSTPGFERKRFDQLLKDAERGIFDAVIVTDPSRWSRDNVKSGQGLQILRDNGIRFFAGQTEHDLFDPTSELFLGMSVQINQYLAKIQTQKSLRSRINRASRSIPTVGNLPFGRTFDRETGIWRIDREKQKRLIWAAQQYLKGEQLSKLAPTLGMKTANLWKTLARRSGDTWELKFRSKRIAIDEKIILKIPPLLDEETIRKIHQKAEADKTYTHGMIKNPYLLARAVFCAKCGYTLFGHMTNRGNRYYRHVANDSRQRKYGQSFGIRADDLEEAVLLRIYATLGDSAGMEQAMMKAIPDRKRIGELRERKSFLESQLSKIETGKNRLIDSIEKGLITDDEVARKMKEIRAKEASVKSEIEAIEPQLSDVPTEEEIKGKAKMIQRILGQIYRTPSRLAKMSFDEKRKLVSSFFSGKDSQGRRMGVYCEKDKEGSIKYEIRGTFGQTSTGTLNAEGPDILNFQDVSVEHFEELKEVAKGRRLKQNILVK